MRLRAVLRIACSLAVGGIVAGLFLSLALTAWERFLFVPSQYSSDLRSILATGRVVLLLSGGVIFGMLAARIAPTSGTLQILVCCIAVGYWLFPYGFLEGVFLPSVPLAGTVIASSGAYLGRQIVSSYRTA
jgi:hypothetical protein